MPACSEDMYASLSTEGKKRALESGSKVASIFWRLVAAIPPLLGSLVATDLSFSLLLAGVAGVHVAFVAPSMLQLRSCLLYPGQTIFSGWHSATALCYPVLVFAGVALFLVLMQIKNAVFSGF